MILSIKNKIASSTVEYMALIVFLLGALFVFEKYILNAFWGQWKKAGDTFSHGRQYDPRSFGVSGEDGGTLICMFVYADKDDPTNMNGFWALQPCWDQCLIEDGETESVCRTRCEDVREFCVEEF